VSEAIICDTVMVDAYHYTFVQTHKMYNTKSELTCNLWTLGNTGSSFVTNIPHCQGMLIMGRLRVEGEGAILEMSTTSCQY
jgi:hypothetical protein